MTSTTKTPIQRTRSNRTNKSKARTQLSLRERFKDIFIDHFDIVIWVIIGLGGLLTFFLTPLKDITYHSLYKEKAEIKLFTENI